MAPLKSCTTIELLSKRKSLAAYKRKLQGSRRILETEKPAGCKSKVATTQPPANKLQPSKVLLDLLSQPRKRKQTEPHERLL